MQCGSVVCARAVSRSRQDDDDDDDECECETFVPRRVRRWRHWSAKTYTRARANAHATSSSRRKPLTKHEA